MPEWKAEIRKQLAGLRLAPTREAEIVEELAQHLDDRYQELLSGGVTEDEAYRAALAELSDSELLARELRRVERQVAPEPIVLGANRRTNMIADLWQDLRFGARILMKQPGFTLIAVLTLALGVGATTGIFSVVHAVLLAPLPYHEPNRLVVLSQKNELKNLTQQPVSYPTLREWQTRNQCFTQVAALRGEAMSLTDGTEPERINVLRSSANILALLGAQPALGRDFHPEEEDPGKATVALVSYGLWQRRYGGDPQLVGQRLTLDGVAHTVIGILPAWLNHPGLPMSSLPPTGADVWIPFVPRPNEQNRTFANLRAIARLRGDASLPQAQAEMTSMDARLRQEFPEMNPQMGIEFTPLYEQVIGQVRQGLWMLTGAVLFVLLIACANIANLLLARATGRQTEIAIRSALGATRGALMRQLLTECIVLSLLGGGVGLALAYWGVPVLTKMSGIPRASEIGLHAPVLLFALLSSLATGLVFGWLPAWQASRAEISGALKEGRKGGGVAQRRWLNGLVVAEIALALVLLIGAGLLLRSFRALNELDPGFRAQNVLTLAVPLPAASYPEQPQQLQFFERALAAIHALPGVDAAALTFRLPIIGFATAIFTAQDQPVPAGQETVADYRAISPAYFRALGIALLQGREFNERDNADAADAVIINEELARRTWPGESPLGKRLQIATERTRWRAVVGVVGNAKLTSLEGKVDPAIYVPMAQNTWPTALRTSSLVVKTDGDPTAMTASIRAALRAIDPSLPVSQVQTLETIVADSLALRRFNLTLLALFAAVAALLAAVGIYGVMSYSVTQRTHELGLRLALGAGTNDILRLILRQGMQLTLLGVGLGIAAALSLTRLLRALLYGVSPTDPLTFAGIAALLTLVALLACWLPARRATKVDPMVALRAE